MIVRELGICIPLLELLASQAKPVTVLQNIAPSTFVVKVFGPNVEPKLNIDRYGFVIGGLNVNVLTPLHHPL